MILSAVFSLSSLTLSSRTTLRTAALPQLHLPGRLLPQKSHWLTSPICPSPGQGMKRTLGTGPEKGQHNLLATYSKSYELCIYYFQCLQFFKFVNDFSYGSQGDKSLKLARAARPHRWLKSVITGELDFSTSLPLQLLTLTFSCLVFNMLLLQ